MKEKSEFGKGLAICLAKFMEHFSNDQMNKLSHNVFLLKKPKEDQEKILSGSPPDNLNYGSDRTEDFIFFINKMVPIWGSEKATISHDITMWANGASDHLYEIEVPKDDPIDEAVYLYLNMLRKIIRKILKFVPRGKVNEFLIKAHNFIPVEAAGWSYMREIVDELQEKGLDMGHGRGLMGGKTYKMEDIVYLSKLTQMALIIIDVKLGLDPDWGEW